MVMLTVPMAMGQVYSKSHRLPFLILAGVTLSFFCLALTVKARTLVRVRRRSIVDEKFSNSPCATPSSYVNGLRIPVDVAEKKVDCDGDYVDLLDDDLAFDPPLPLVSTLVRVRRRSIVDEKFSNSPCANHSRTSSHVNGLSIPVDVAEKKYDCEGDYVDLLDDDLAFDPPPPLAPTTNKLILGNDRIHSIV